MKKILLFVGTRPEAIKLAPVILELRSRPAEFETLVCATGQHREMLDQALQDFDIAADEHLDLMTHNQSLAGLTARLFEHLEPVIQRYQPDWVLVQGDTTTVMVAALVAFYNGVKVGHVEAGLRTGDLRRPFPEELNRRVAGVVADRHYAPTASAQANLLAESVPPEQVMVTGNTVVDALYMMRDKVEEAAPKLPAEVSAGLMKAQRMVLVTGHRRENFGEAFEQIFTAIRDLATAFPDTVFIYPVHLNPNVRKPVNAILSGIENVVLCEPVAYRQVVYLMNRAALILTDSGGIQEEGVSLGRQVLVTREVTERPEGAESGLLTMVGVDREAITQAVTRVLGSVPSDVEPGASPYGDGQAAQRIADDLAAS